MLTATRGNRSISAMAERLGVNKNTLGSYERGHSQPDVEFLVKFSDATGVSLMELLDLRVRAAGARLNQNDPASEHLRTAVDDLEAQRAAPPAQLDEELLVNVLTAVEEHLAAERRTLPPAKKAGVAAILYSGAVQVAAGEPKRLDPDAARRLLRLVS